MGQPRDTPLPLKWPHRSYPLRLFFSVTFNHTEEKAPQIVRVLISVDNIVYKIDYPFTIPTNALSDLVLLKNMLRDSKARVKANLHKGPCARHFQNLGTALQNVDKVTYKDLGQIRYDLDRELNVSTD
jgi:hypothetical protein